MPSPADSQSFVRCQRGATAVTFAMSSVVMLAIGGGAVDFARAHANKTEMQKAADAAVLAGAMLADATEDQRKNVTARIFQANYSSNRFAPTTPNVTVLGDTVSLSAGADVETPFLKIIGISSYAVGVQSAAATNAGALANRICVLALNPDSIDSIDMHGSAEIAAPTCRFHANSAHSTEALILQGSGIARTAGMCAVGTAVVDSAFTAVPMPQSNCSVVPDPLANWAAPSVPGVCDFGVSGGLVVGLSFNAATNTTLSPGRYCGDVRINAATVTLLPGRYFFTDGNLSINATADVIGDGVYFHIAPNMKSFGINGSANVRLTKSTDAALRGVLLYKQPDLVGGLKFKSSINGNSDVTLNGAIYAPKDEFLMGGNSDVYLTQQSDMTVIADKVELHGSTYLEIKADPAAMATSLFPPSTAKTARLVN